MIIIKIAILTFTSMAINFIFLFIYRKAVKEIGWRDDKISHLQRKVDFYEETWGKL